jgi:hypothetical protein
MTNVEDTLKTAVEIGRTDFLFFCQTFLPKQFNLEPGSFHKDLCKIPSGKQDWNVIVVPRHHGKSTIFSFALPIWLGCYNKGTTPILLVSETGDLAEKWLGLIKVELESNELILAAFGDMKGGKWSARNIELNNGCAIVARGAGQQARGYHWKVIICDDLEGGESNRSELQLDYLRDWFDRELFYTIDAQSRIYYIGTVISPNCHILDLKKRAETNKEWRSYWLTAYAGGIENEENAIFPAKWNHEALQKLKSNNPFAFAQEMMNEPVPDSDKRFKAEWVQFYDNAPSGLRVFTTIDPSISTKKRADKTAIVTCGLDGNGRIFVLDVYNLVNDPLVMVEEIFRINKMFCPYKLGIETVIFQKMLKIYLEEKARERNIYLPIEELRPDGKESKQMRIMSLIPYFSEKRVFIKKGMYSLIQQLREFSPNLLNMKDDVLDALSYQMQLWLKPGNSTGIAKMTDEEFTKAIQEKAMKDLFSDNIAIENNRRYRSGYTVGL